MEDGVRQATVALAAALERGDAVAAAALYADDGKLLSPAAELITGRREIEAYWRAGIAFGLSAVELRTIDVEIADGTAVEIGRYVLSLVADSGEPVADCGKYLVLHRRLPDGSWRRAVDVFNPDAPAPVRHDAQEER
jgi:uncharacterized protein (TIGR02246 family)